MNQELKDRIKSIQTPIISNVLQHFWVNNANKEVPFIFVEWFEIHFKSGEIMVLQNNLEKSCIEAFDFNLDDEKKLIASQFGNQIFIKTEVLSKLDFWKPLINNEKLMISVDPIIEECDYPGAISLDIGTYLYLISPSESEGIDIEGFEID